MNIHSPKGLFGTPYTNTVFDPLRLQICLNSTWHRWKRCSIGL